MYDFPPGLYTDVRVEKVFATVITFDREDLRECNIHEHEAALIRVFDGKRWYYASTTDPARIQEEIDALAALAGPAGAGRSVAGHPVVEKFIVSTGEYLQFTAEKNVASVPKEEKIRLLTSYFPVFQGAPLVKLWRAYYRDRRVEKAFYSSKGSRLVFDTQHTGFAFTFELARKEKKFSQGFEKAGSSFSELQEEKENLEDFLAKCTEFLDHARPVKPGKYTVVLAPEPAGVIAHESFGHKSEADFMMDNEKAMKEWAIGKKVGAEILSIVDDGNRPGTGYVPFDDEGTPAQATYLVKNGILAGRLHSVATAAALGEEPTGNARAISFEYEPIVRMTTTFILPGSKSKEELLGEVKEGILVEKVNHGTGHSTFTLMPTLAYRIKNGRIAGPVSISALTGDLFTTLAEIDGLSDRLELYHAFFSGCGKWEQAPLPVAFGGPYVRVRNLLVY